MAGPGFLSILVMAVIALLPIAGMIALWVWVIRRSRPRRAACGSCGYDVGGLEGMTCPECGGDLRQVGIVSSRQRLVHPALFIVLWSLLLPLPALMLSTLALRMGPVTATTSWSVDVSTLSGAVPPFGLGVDQSGAARGFIRTGGLSISQQSGMRAASATIGLPGSGQLDIDQITLRPRRGSTLRLEPTVVQDRLDQASTDRLKAWLFDIAATSTTSPALRDDAAAVHELIEAIVTDQASFTTTRLRFAGGTSFGNQTTPTWFTAAIIVFWIALWAGGIAIFFARRRRALRAEVASAG